MECLKFHDVDEEIRTKAYEWYRTNVAKPMPLLAARRRYFRWLEKQGVIYPNLGPAHFKDESSKTLFLLRWS